MMFGVRSARSAQVNSGGPEVVYRIGLRRRSTRGEAEPAAAPVPVRRRLTVAGQSFFQIKQRLRRGVVLSAGRDPGHHSDVRGATHSFARGYHSAHVGDRTRVLGPVRCNDAARSPQSEQPTICGPRTRRPPMAEGKRWPMDWRALPRNNRHQCDERRATRRGPASVLPLHQDQGLSVRRA
jgi:hypothetical protein